MKLCRFRDAPADKALQCKLLRRISFCNNGAEDISQYLDDFGVTTLIQQMLDCYDTP